ncbi:MULTISPECIES: pitrilysin family protein [unclassified Lysobacter]|uniref:M16 family metallopeptidase n=1 Tax=unclassified Lysobacter TaxID=2635362 RepID=UPI001BE908FC|nr:MULTISPECIES: pitrilysin family protein [unclassified Lysobacter]MBT2745708.1 insulinase family protein [Lysobacter sp. ISL-42]MBT2749733.1 insulinase family protein [Lysobacter sp. ISL-50]MBT2777548.1 insulinase family protein [Lysobacter sp. ISL-54]MBT2782036.1 insulinase family protein [Lysobacter sp. ISL-52]
MSKSPSSALAPRRARPRVAALALALGVALVGGAIAPAAAAAKDNASVSIAFDEFTLPNGLRVIVHTDTKAPIVAVNVWYHVGSKNEQPGRTGFAHLFEHLMFQGSENYKGEFFTPFELVGTTDQNGTTNVDRTNYFQNVPTTALDMALWMESDRMGHLLGAIDQKTLDEQRGVVQNEKRQGENQPYGRRISARLYEALYPADHPYSWQTIGSMADLDAASLGDVKTWFRSWYGPNNAVLVLAGDIDLKTAKEKVLRFFGDIPASATLPDMATRIPKRDRDTEETIPDRVPQARVYRGWPVAQYGAADGVDLQLFAQVLGGSAASRLDARLVHADRIADSASVSINDAEISGTLVVVANVKQGVEPAKVRAAIDEEIKRLIAQGPSAQELEQAKTSTRAEFVRGVERIGGFGGKSDVLARCAVFLGKADCYRDELKDLDKASVASVQAAGRKWLGVGSHTIVVQPGDKPASSLPETVSAAPAKQPAPIPAADPRFKTVQSDLDRGLGVPQTQSFPALKFPAQQTAQLSNGMQVVLVERHETPIVQLQVEFPGGFSADQGRKAGTASFAMAMLDEGAGDYGALQLSARKEALGAELSSNASLDSASVALSALTDKLDPSLDLLSDVIRRPRFDAAEIERVRAQWLAGIKQEKARPQTAALRVLPPLLYGAGHAYAIPFTGTGTESSIAALKREDLLAFHGDWLQPRRARVIVVGDTTLAQIVPQLERRFGDWKGASDAPALPNLAQVARPAKPRVFLVDQPGAIQSNIYVGELIAPTGDAGTIDFDFANGVLGGEFSSRLNMNLREDKHWAYGSYSGSGNALGQRPWIAQAAVQSDKTVESLGELKREIEAFTSGSKPVTETEVVKIRAANTLSLPGAYETTDALMAQVGSDLRYGRPSDFILKYKARNDAMTPALTQAAAKALEPKALTWVVVGDLSKIEQPVRALGIGEVQVIDNDGKPVR